MKEKKDSRIPKIAVIIGTRAQLVKMGPVIKELQDRKIPFDYVHTNQHKITMDSINEGFGLKKPDFNFFPQEKQKETKTMGLIWGWFMQSMMKIIFKPSSLLRVHKNGIVLVHGDTNSCWMGALLGKIRRNKVMHVESGLRSFNIFKPFPEEINRLITFRLTDVYACPNDWACNNLKKYKGVKLNTKMNTQYDALKIALDNKDKVSFETPTEPYIVSSIHRYENVFKEEKLERIVRIHEKIAEKFLVVFVLYPVTEKRLRKYGLMERLEKNPKIKLQERLSFFEYMKLQYNSEFVVADGGSIQEELSYMGKPTLLLRDVTERIEGINRTAVVSKFDDKVISDFLKNYKDYEHPFLEVETSPSKIIVDWLVENGYT